MALVSERKRPEKRGRAEEEEEVGNRVPLSVTQQRKKTRTGEGSEAVDSAAATSSSSTAIVQAESSPMAISPLVGTITRWISPGGQKEMRKPAPETFFASRRRTFENSMTPLRDAVTFIRRRGPAMIEPTVSAMKEVLDKDTEEEEVSSEEVTGNRKDLAPLTVFKLFASFAVLLLSVFMALESSTSSLPQMNEISLDAVLIEDLVSKLLRIALESHQKELETLKDRMQSDKEEIANISMNLRSVQTVPQQDNGMKEFLQNFLDEDVFEVIEEFVDTGKVSFTALNSLETNSANEDVHQKVEQLLSSISILEREFAATLKKTTSQIGKQLSEVESLLTEKIGEGGSPSAMHMDPLASIRQEIQIQGESPIGRPDLTTPFQGITLLRGPGRTSKSYIPGCDVEVQLSGAVGSAVSFLKDSLCQWTFSAPSVISVFLPTFPIRNCWSFKGSQGSISILLPSRGIIRGFYVEHQTTHLLPLHARNVTPKTLRLVGLNVTGNVEEELATMTFQNGGPAVQKTFTSEKTRAQFDGVKIDILANHGGPYTCLHKIGIF